MIDELKKNIETEIEILREISNYNNRLNYASASEIRLIEETISALKNNLKIVNASIPSLLNKTELIKKLPSANEYMENKIEKGNQQESSKEFSYKKIEILKGAPVTIRKKDARKFMKQLNIAEENIKRLKKKKRKITYEVGSEGLKKSKGFMRLSNKFFLNTSQKLIEKGYFKSLFMELNRSNMEVLSQTYVSIMLFSSLLAFIFSIILFGFLMAFDLSINFPFIKFYEGNILSRILTIFWIPIVLPIATFIFLYFYPSSERKTLTKKIDNELPFAVIHMSAISGSGIEPTQIFKIIGLSNEYPNLRREIRKVLNQINIYGYDLVNALNNVSRTTPSKKLAELFNGLSTTITTGGNLKAFFEKRAETLLIEYKLEREKFTRVAEIFMDIYISIIIAAPMILMLLLTILNVAMPSLMFGISTLEASLIVVAVIALINILFLMFLHLKQPPY